MSVLASDIATTIGPFIAEAAACGLTPPVRLLDHDARAWLLLHAGDMLAVDGFGDLWWVRSVGRDARIVRPPWPEEITRHRSAIQRAVAEIRARAAHPAGRH